MNEALVDKRLLFGLAYGCFAASILIAHNHPSGNVKPSQADFRCTKDLIDAARLLGFSLVDHLVIGDNQYYSFLSKTRVGDCVLNVSEFL